MKKLLLCILLISNSLYSQNSICGLSPIDKSIINCLAESPSVNAFNNSLIKYISEEIGISPNFTFKYCANIKNAAAIINPLQNNTRYILFDSDYFNNLYNRDKLSVLFIIAHEMGHHLNGHTIPKKHNNIYELQQQELEADYFAGYIMFKLGASEKNIIETINKFPDPQNDYSSHPKNSLRINYALKGYLNEVNKYKAELYQIREKLSRELNREIALKELDELINSLNQYATTNDTKHLDIAEYILKKIDNGSSTTDKLKAYINYKKGRYELAFEFYKTKYLQTRDSDDLVDFLNILSKTNKKSKEIESIINNLENTSENPEVLLNLGIYYKQIADNQKSRLVLKKAYDLIKDKDDSILKSDILFSYGRAIYDEQLLKNEENMSFSKILLMKAKQIIEKYPNDKFYRLYYNPILFHLGNIQNMDKDYKGAIDTYNQLLIDEKDRKDYIYKVNASLGNIHMLFEEYSEAIQYFTTAINNCEDDEFKKQYFFLRGRSYILNKNTTLGINDIKTSCKMGEKLACETLNDIDKIIKTN